MSTFNYNADQKRLVAKTDSDQQQQGHEKEHAEAKPETIVADKSKELPQVLSQGVLLEHLLKATKIKQQELTDKFRQDFLKQQEAQQYNAYRVSKTWKSNCLEGVTAEELEAAGIESMQSSPLFGDVTSFFVDKCEQHKLTLYARSREFDEKKEAEKLECSRLIDKLSALPGLPGSKPFEHNEFGYSGLVILRHEPGKIKELVEVDAHFVMHDVYVYHA